MFMSDWLTRAASDCRRTSSRTFRMPLGIIERMPIDTSQRSQSGVVSRWKMPAWEVLSGSKLTPRALLNGWLGWFLVPCASSSSVALTTRLTRTRLSSAPILGSVRSFISS